MNTHSILPPVFALVALSFAILIVMFRARVATMAKKHIPMEKLADNSRFDEYLYDATNPADNFINLFEMPVLFFVAALLIHFSSLTDSTYIMGAWAYVFCRLAHSVIHCSYNRVMHRFVAYFLSCAVLLAMWVRLALQLL